MKHRVCSRALFLSHVTFCRTCKHPLRGWSMPWNEVYLWYLR